MSRRKKAKKRTPCNCDTCSRCRRSEQLRLAWAEGRRTKPDRYSDWQPDEDALLRAYLGMLTLEEVAARLWEEISQYGGRRRTVKAIMCRATTLGLSLRSRFLTVADVERLMGTHDRRVHWWITHGLLAAVRPPGQHKHQITRESLEQFVRDYPWAYEWADITDRRLRAFAEVQDRYLSTKEAAWALGVGVPCLRGEIAAGVVPVVKPHGNGWRIRAKDLPRIRAEIEQRRRAALERSALAFARTNRERREAALLRRAS